MKLGDFHRNKVDEIIMATPKISVIVPVYNTEKYLERCVKSLINQTLKDIEIILVDDGSPDGSGALCDEYARKDARVKAIHKENAGQGLARNDGIKAAASKYICFLDSDDYYELNACEVLVNTMEGTDADICSYGYRLDDPDGNLVKCPKVNNREYVGEEVRDKFILHYFGDSMKDEELRGVSSCMSVFKRSITVDNDINFPSERVVSSEDTAFCLEFCRYIKKAVTISDVLYHYCQNEGSFSQAYNPNRLRLMKAHIELLGDYSSKYGNYDQVKDRIAMTAWINLIAHFKQVYRKFNRRDAIRCYKEISEDQTICRALKELQQSELPSKQRLLYHALRLRMYALVYILIEIRAKKRL